MAKKEEMTASFLLDPHFGHLIRFRSRSEMDIVSVYFFRHPLQRKSYVGIAPPSIISDFGLRISD